MGPVGNDETQQGGFRRETRVALRREGDGRRRIRTAVSWTQGAQLADKAQT